MLLNFPSDTNKNIWRDHLNVCGLSGRFLFLYYNQLPRIAYISDVNENECINYFLNRELFLKPPPWIIVSNNSFKKIFRYVNRKYKLYNNDLDWNEVKHSEPIEITKYCAVEVVKKIYEGNKKWLEDEKSRRAIQAIPRIFAEPTVLIYELIQNAFDANATIVKIELNEEILEFYHNGHKFTESDVNSISFVNLSNKDKDKIGFMGIGFKSVFEAADKPEIHSPPFSFLFDNSVEGGFILPKKTVLKEIKEPYTTLICIPFKNKEIYELINRGLAPEEQVGEELGFSRKTFLHLLREINSKLLGITNIETPYMKFNIIKGRIPYTYQIRDNTNEREASSELWLRREKKFKPNPIQTADFLTSRSIKNRELERVGWEEIVSVVIPLAKNGPKYSPNKEYNGILNVYLPTKIKTGLKFDIQGNFLVDATRKNIKNIQGEWNKELFSHISDLLIDIFEWCKLLDNSELIDLPKFYSLIPDWNEIEFLPSDILENIKSRFIKSFNSKQLIPTEINSSMKIQYKCPCECIIVDNAILDLFGKKTIEELSKKKVALRGLDEETRQKVLDSSDTSKWTIEESIALLSKDEWIQYLPKFKNQQQCNKWLSKLYAYLTQHFPQYMFREENIKMRDKILDCYIFPIEWSDAEKEYRFTRSIFMEKKLYRFPREQAKLPLEAFQDRINVLNQSFENYIRGRTGGLTEEEKEIIEDSNNLLERVNIPILEPTTIIKDFIIPLFKDVARHNKDTLVDYTSFICNHLQEVRKENVAIDILLLNKKGEFCNPPDLFFGEEYGFSDIKKVFGNDKDEIFISGQYLEKRSISTNDWVELFSYVGVNTNLPCKTIKEKLYPCQLKEMVGAEIPLSGPRVGYINEDFPGGKYLILDTDFSNIVKVRLEEIKVLPLKLKRDSMCAFLKILDRSWEQEYSTKKTITMKYYAYGQSAGLLPYKKTIDKYTKFAEYLLSENWVPATNSDDLRNPKEVVALTEENISLSDEGVILCEEIIKNAQLLEFLSFKPNPENVTNLHRLMNLKSKNILNIDKYKELYSLIYGDIKNNKLTEADVRNDFMENKLIYANNRFWSPKELIYSPPPQLQLYLPQLDKIYSGLEHFFCDVLGCPKEEPHIEHIIQYFLNFVWKMKRGMSDEFRATIVYGYRKILDFITDKENKDFLESLMWGRFRAEAKVFCKNVGWVEIKSDKPIVYVDKVKYEKRYATSDKIYVESHLSQLRRDTKDMMPLLDFFNILPISKNTEEKFEILGEKEIYPNTDKIEKNMNLLVDTVTKILDSKAEDLTAKGRERSQVNKFTQMTKDFKSKRVLIYKVPNIKTTIHLNGEELFSVKKTCHISNMERQLEIYITDDVRSVYGCFKDELITELQINILSGQLKDLIQNMITNSVANIEDNFAKSISNFLIENGFESDDKTKDVFEQEKREYEEELVEKEVETEEGAGGYSEEGDIFTKEEEKKPYEEIIDDIDYSNVNIRMIGEQDLDYKSDEEKEVKIKPKRRINKRFHRRNPYSDEDGKRGEEIVFEKEKERLKEIGLDSYILKVFHISKRIPDNPWDIESFDIEDGKIVPIRIEVKATPEPDNYVFPMSEKELLAALKENHPKGRYFIYRVFDVRSAVPYIERFDFYRLFSKKLINFKSKDFYIELIVKKSKQIEKNKFE